MYGKLDFLHAAFAIVPPDLDGYESTQDLPAFDVQDAVPAFLLETFLQEDFYLKNGTIADGSRKAKRIHEETFLNMVVSVPEVREQQRVASILASLDQLIALHQRRYMGGGK